MHVIDHVSMCGSVFMMVALTLERHFAICSPHAYRYIKVFKTIGQPGLFFVYFTVFSNKQCKNYNKSM